MKYIDIVSNVLNIVGLLCLTSNRPFVDLIKYWKRELGVHGQSNYYIIGDINEKWFHKYAVPTGISCIILGNIGLLLVSIFE